MLAGLSVVGESPATTDMLMPLDADTIAPGVEGPERPSAGVDDGVDLADAFRELTRRLKERRRPERQVQDAPPPPVLVETVPPPPPSPPPVKPAPPDPGESVSALLDIIWGAIDLLPQERSMISDALLLLAPRLTERQLVSLSERLSGMDAPPPLLVARLIRDPRLEVAGPLLEKNAHLSDRDVVAAVGLADSEKLKLICRRRSISPAVSDHVVASADLEALQILLRNPGSDLFFSTYMQLCAIAAEHPVLRGLLTTRTDLPLPVALELFWCLPPELRRVILSRFLTDSVTLNRIIAIVTASDVVETSADAEPQAAGDLDAAIAALTSGRQEAAVQMFSRLAGITEATALRIVSDATGEPLAALLKLLGLSRAGFTEVTAHLNGEGWTNAGQTAANLQAVFDGLSASKARSLLIYWDWFTRKLGPYAPQA
jgi:uncharacterized protein (DUF2336 family)